MRQIDDTYSILLEREAISRKEGVRVQSSLQNFARLVWRMVSETDAAALKDNDDEVARNRPDDRICADHCQADAGLRVRPLPRINRGYEKLYQEDYLRSKRQGSGQE